MADVEGLRAGDPEGAEVVDNVLDAGFEDVVAVGAGDDEMGIVAVGEGGGVIVRPRGKEGGGRGVVEVGFYAGKVLVWVLVKALFTEGGDVEFVMGVSRDAIFMGKFCAEIGI